MNNVAFESASRLARLIKRRSIGCLDLLEHYLERVEQHNPTLNAIVVIDDKRARSRAHRADRAIAKGEW